MKILISPSKTLSFDSEVNCEFKSESRLIDETKILHKILLDYSSEDFKNLMSVSDKIAELNYNRFKNQIGLIVDLPLSKNKKKSIISLIENYQLVKSIKFDHSYESKPPYELTKIFGIGPWTVEMFSIFHLGISNILPKGDLGFINAYKKYYNDKNLNKLDKNSKNWSNYSTIVTWYLWSSYDSEPLYL